MTLADKLHDADLLSLYPALAEMLDEMWVRPVYAHGQLTETKMVTPAAYSAQNGGYELFYGLTDDPATFMPDGYWSGAPVVSTTWLNALRSAWMWQCRLSVDLVGVWEGNRPIVWQDFQALLFDVRGWRQLDIDTRYRVRSRVLASVTRAAEITTTLPRWS